MRVAEAAQRAPRNQGSDAIPDRKIDAADIFAAVSQLHLWRFVQNGSVRGLSGKQQRTGCGSNAPLSACTSSALARRLSWLTS
jgi:hypothetical protein